MLHTVPTIIGGAQKVASADLTVVWHLLGDRSVHSLPNLLVYVVPRLLNVTERLF